MPYDLGNFSCSVIWRDSLFLKGGNLHSREALKYNFSQNNWMNLTSGETGFGVSNPGKDQNNIHKHFVLNIKWFWLCLSLFQTS
jgi:hypothetical protein